MKAHEIVKLLEDNGITAAEEYFSDDTEFPYAVVLTPSSVLECSDTGAVMNVIAASRVYRIELFTKSKDDPVRNKFLNLIAKNAGVPSVNVEEQSFGANCGYLTAVEYET